MVNGNEVRNRNAKKPLPVCVPPAQQWVSLFREQRHPRDVPAGRVRGIETIEVLLWAEVQQL